MIRTLVCARRLQFEFAPEAERDFVTILERSIATWGIDQAVQYKQTLDEATDSLCAHPLLGIDRSDIFSGCRALRVEHHRLFYRIMGRKVVIVRILHERQRIEGQFDNLD